MSGQIGLPISMLQKGYFGKVVNCIQNTLLMLNKVTNSLIPSNGFNGIQVIDTSCLLAIR